MVGTGVAKGELAGEGVVLGERQHEGGRADLQERRDLRRVGIADDHVEAAVFAGVGVGFVASVDDRTLQRGFEPHLLLEEVGALCELEIDVVDPHARRFGAHLAGAGVDLARDEVRGGA